MAVEGDLIDGQQMLDAGVLQGDTWYDGLHADAPGDVAPDHGSLAAGDYSHETSDVGDSHDWDNAFVHGDAPDTVQLLLPGGTIGEIGMGQSDTPELELDRRYLLFVQQEPSGWKVIGGEQGAILLEGGVAGVTGQGEATDAAVASVDACVAP